MYGNILDSGADVIVIPVNVCGVMGAGLAKAAKERWPSYFADYASACHAKTLTYNTLHIWRGPTSAEGTPKYIVSFPTKNHWKDLSSAEHIERMLPLLCSEVSLLAAFGARTVAVPALGCGRGGLHWEGPRGMKAILMRGLDPMTHVGLSVVLFPPSP